jgi:hypothetical protein
VSFQDEDWAVAKEITEQVMGTGRNAIIEAFLRWYLHRPGAVLPERPPESTAAEAYDRWYRAAELKAEGDQGDTDG